MTNTWVVALVAGLSTIILGYIPILDATGARSSLGKYTCRIENVYGVDELGKTYMDATFIYDADTGTMDGSLHLNYPALGEWDSPFSTWWSRLKVETPPSDVNHLHATQYEPVGGANVRPTMAWLMLETMDNPLTPRFQFFSTGIRSIAVGSCTRA